MTARSLVLFALAGLAEISGGYLIWRWLRENGSPILGLVGGLLLVAYGVIPTLQPTTNFGRVYAAYGGVFVVLSLLWGWAWEGQRPDRCDWIGATIISVGGRGALLRTPLNQLTSATRAARPRAQAAAKRRQPPQQAGPTPG